MSELEIAYYKERLKAQSVMAEAATNEKAAAAHRAIAAEYQRRIDASTKRPTLRIVSSN